MRQETLDKARKRVRDGIGTLAESVRRLDLLADSVYSSISRLTDEVQSIKRQSEEAGKVIMAGAQILEPRLGREPMCECGTCKACRHRANNQTYRRKLKKKKAPVSPKVIIDNRHGKTAGEIMRFISAQEPKVRAIIDKKTEEEMGL